MADSLRLRDIFQDSIFRVPDYQRGYAWEESQLGDFWEDLEVLPAGKMHYTGALFLERSSQVDPEDRWLVDEGFAKYDVVDGQQRLTTIAILLNELIGALGEGEGYGQSPKAELVGKYLYRKSLSGNLKSYMVGYAASDPNHGHLLAKIYGDSAAVVGNSYNAYVRNLEFARDFFRERVRALPHPKREELFLKLANHLLFDRREVEPGLEVESVFETMNNRGKKLTILERLKNRLIYISKYLELGPDELATLRKKIHDTWGVVYAQLARNPAAILDEDDFFISYFSLLEKGKESVFSNESADETVFRMFSHRAERYGYERVTYGAIDEFLAGLAASAKAWYEIHNSGRNDVLKRILRLTTIRDVKIFLVAVHLDPGTDAAKRRVLEKAERALFRNNVPGMDMFDARDFANWARDLYGEEKDLAEIDRRLDEVLARPVDKDAFLTGVGYLFTYVRGNHGYHRWSALKYFLYCYDEKLRAEFRERDIKLDYDRFDEDSIEHVIPRTWENNWPHAFDGIGLRRSRDYDWRNAIVNSLGNLTVLAGGKNSSLGDRDWATKKARYATGCYNEIEIAREAAWTVGSVTSRGLKLLEFLLDKAGGPALTDEEKFRALYPKENVAEAMQALHGRA